MQQQQHVDDYVCYLLEQTSPCKTQGRGRSTYIGVTRNLHRRLRQHCGEIRGGARRTRGAQWRVVLWVQGFHTYAEALQFEWAFQKRRLQLSDATRSFQRQASGVKRLAPKLRRLHALTLLPRWTRAAPEACTRQLCIVCQDCAVFQALTGGEGLQLAASQAWPSFVSIRMDPAAVSWTAAPV
jgi:predicted GIY-YIG superfamily endonuclease